MGERSDRLATQNLDDDDGNEEVEEVDEVEDNGNVDGANSTKSKGKRRKRYNIHPMTLKDNFANGNKKLKEKPTKKTRQVGKARSDRKRRLMKALVEWFGATDATTKK